MDEIDSELEINQNKWKAGAFHGLKRFSYVAGVFFIYLLFNTAGLIPPTVVDQLSLIISVILFALGIPLSLLLRVDTMSETLGILNREILLACAAALAAVNFACLGALFGWKKKKKKKRPSD